MKKKYTIGILTIVILLMIAVVSINPVETKKDETTQTQMTNTDSNTVAFYYGSAGTTGIASSIYPDFWWCDGNKWCWKD